MKHLLSGIPGGIFGVLCVAVFFPTWPFLLRLLMAFIGSFILSFGMCVIKDAIKDRRRKK